MDARTHSRIVKRLNGTLRTHLTEDFVSQELCCLRVGNSKLFGQFSVVAKAQEHPVTFYDGVGSSVITTLVQHEAPLRFIPSATTLLDARAPSPLPAKNLSVYVAAFPLESPPVYPGVP